MGCRTYIYNLDNNTNCCLGKLVAYVEPDDNMKLLKWCREHLTDKDDLEYIEQYADVGYCCEAITFKQIFTRQEILDFFTCYVADKQYMCKEFPYFQNDMWADILKTLSSGWRFKIEWTEGG